MSHVSRRSFIRTFSGGVLGGAALYAFSETARAKYVIAYDEQILPNDEHFWAFVRDQFPLKRQPVYLNNGTMGPSPYVVMDATKEEMEDVDRTGRYGGWEDVRGKVAHLIHATTEEISLTHNVTEGINVVACGLRLGQGDEVIMTNHEHAGNALPWLARARRDGIVIKVVSLAPTADETLNRINDSITSRTRVIAVPHITCTIGQVLPATDICKLGHDKGLHVMIDGAHTPGMMPVDVHAMGCDFFATCGHKWMMGPKGTGFLFVKEGMTDVLEPYWVGGGVDKGWDLLKGTLEYKSDAHKFDFATQSSAVYVGLGAAIDFLYHLGQENIALRGGMLAMHLRTELKKFGERVEILTPEEPGGYGSVLGFRLRSIPFDNLQKVLLETHGIITRMVPENGVNCNRVSTHIYNTPDEVDRLVSILGTLV